MEIGSRQDSFGFACTPKFFAAHVNVVYVKTMTRTKKIVLGIAAALVVAAGAMVGSIGPSNVIGMLRYDQREEGRLKVGDAAPDVTLYALDAVRQEKLSAHIGGKPLVLIFGSFT